MLKNLFTLVLSVFFASILFAFASASASNTVTVTAAGSATSSTVQIINTVVPVSTGTPVMLQTNTPACLPYISVYNKLGAYGPEVAKLQMFLNQHNGSKLNGQGYFGPVTEQEVKNFQFTYGIRPTGYQHVLTTKMINDIHCGRVAVKPRKVYVEASDFMSTTNNGYVTPAPVVSNSVNMDKINNKSNDLVKKYQAPKTIKLVGTGTNATDTATKTSFWENLKKDWAKIQENYKAYLLVFALVLALFWFLRKAATE